MTIQAEINEYLNDCPMFFFGTVEDDAPVVRPLGFHMEQGGQLYFGVGTFKNVYKQLQANPNVYLAACKSDGSSWIRVAGTAVCDSDPALVDACFATMPDLKPVYEQNGWEMGIFHLENATATWVEGPMTPVRTETF